MSGEKKSETAALSSTQDGRGGELLLHLNSVGPLVLRSLLVRNLGLHTDPAISNFRNTRQPLGGREAPVKSQSRFASRTPQSAL